TAPAGCTAAGTFCPTATTVGTCTQDADSCFSKAGNDTTCMNGQVCVVTGNTAACACPTVIGTTLGTGCQTVGQTVCSGDTLPTNDAAPTPANYRLDYLGSVGAAVTLANGSAVSGFTIANANAAPNANNPAVAIGCTVGTVTVNGVSLSGTSINSANTMAAG